MRKWFLIASYVVATLLLFAIYNKLIAPKAGGYSVENRSQTPTPVSKHRKATLILLGDIMLGRSVNIRSLDKNDPTYPFLKVADRLRKADIVFANLENPIIGNCPRIEHGFTFCADPRMVEGLVFAGIDIVNLANNHTKNFGEKGFEETKRFLEESKIKWVGDNNLEIIEKDGIKFGFLGFDFVSRQPMDADFDLIKSVDKEVDVLIVGVHWGDEYKPIANRLQTEAAHQIVIAGGDIISGHHPHWVQNIEHIDKKPIYYSLGNFIFDQMWSEETKKGLAVELTFDNGEIVKEKRLKSYIREWAQPEWAE